MTTKSRICRYSVKTLLSDSAVEGFFELTLPKGSIFLSVQTKGKSEPSMWFLEPVENTETVTYKFRVLCTGEVFDAGDMMTHLGTFQVDDPRSLVESILVFHLFVCGNWSPC